MNCAAADRARCPSGDNPEVVFEQIHSIMHLFRTGQYRVLRGEASELTHMEGKLLGFFARQPGATLRDLAVQSGRDKGQLARLIKSLRQQGFLAAESPKSDRRSVHLQLTPAGCAIHQTLQRQVGLLAKVAVKGLNDHECRQLAGLLERVQANLEASIAQPKAPET